MASKRKKFLYKFEEQCIKILKKKDLFFDEKRDELDKHFKNHGSIGRNQRHSIEQRLFSEYKEYLYDSIAVHFDLNTFLKPDELLKFIDFLGEEILNPKFNNIKKKLKVYQEFKKTESRNGISKEVIENVLENFYQYAPARRLNRKVIYNAGPTNSGKTYGAVQDLIKSESGCYLAPLRLLAWEKYEELSPHHVTALITGEEANRPDNYTHSSSTIEMANFNKKYQVAIIDEIQMIGDLNRGWSWTKSLMNIQADKVYLCGDASAIPLVKKICELCGDELEIVNHERKTTLSFIDKPVQESEIEKGDAIVVFSRREALLKKSHFENLGFNVSIIYGMMTPEVRKEQAQLFLDGKTDIVISTDAIGMGLNLPIRRVIFSTIVKYYDKQEHVITSSEIKQIAGRAGRFGLYEEGFFGVLDQKYNNKWNFKKELSKNQITQEIKSDNKFMLDTVKNALIQTLAPIKTAIVGPDYETLEILNKTLTKDKFETMSVLEFLYFFKQIKTNELFCKSEFKDLVTQAEMVHYDLKYNHKKDHLLVEDVFKFVVAPVMLNKEEHTIEFQKLCTNFFANIVSSHKSPSKLSDLDSNELDLKCIELFQWLSNQFESGFNFDKDKLVKDKKTLIDSINHILIQDIKS
jgi:ATP-dependent RNA helicase SUPV3L1/SUV3